MKFILFANTDWYLYNFRLSTARRLQTDGHEVVMLSPPGEFGARFAQHGFRWVPLRTMDRASLNPLREARVLGELVRVLRAEKPDLLHSFTVKCAVYGALAARAARVPAVVNAVAGMGFVYASDSARARMLRPVVSRMMRMTLGAGRSRVILQNPDDAEAFVRAKLVPETQIRVIRSSGVNLERFRPPARDDAVAPAARRPLRVLLAARLLWEKGVGEYVEAARILKAQGRDVEFLLAGTPDPGNPRSVTQAEAEAWAREGAVQWLGHVEDMPSLMASADAMVLPSYYREGVPKSLIEAAACGLALVTTNLPGCREVVRQHGICGLHVEPRNATQLAERIALLDDDRALLRRLGETARSRALSEFDEQIVIGRTLDVYRELLPPREATPAPVRIAVGG
ncbi:glycosyltransferase family 4 protein [Tolypothrix campylonemoides VB511288]|nr:glycosyltransferase family 4 protein [Tolypothrix campylonemoides VB511288]